MTIDLQENSSPAYDIQNSSSIIQPAQKSQKIYTLNSLIKGKNKIESELKNARRQINELKSIINILSQKNILLEKKLSYDQKMLSVDNIIQLPSQVVNELYEFHSTQLDLLNSLKFQTDNPCASHSYSPLSHPHLCIICHHHLRTMLFLPCRHLVCCEYCYNQLSLPSSSRTLVCPLCRSRTIYAFHIYLC